MLANQLSRGDKHQILCTPDSPVIDVNYLGHLSVQCTVNTRPRKNKKAPKENVQTTPMNDLENQ